MQRRFSRKNPRNPKRSLRRNPIEVRQRAEVEKKKTTRKSVTESDQDPGVYRAAVPVGAQSELVRRIEAAAAVVAATKAAIKAAARAKAGRVEGAAVTEAASAAGTEVEVTASAGGTVAAGVIVIAAAMIDEDVTAEAAAVVVEIAVDAAAAGDMGERDEAGVVLRLFAFPFCRTSVVLVLAVETNTLWARIPGTSCQACRRSNVGLAQIAGGGTAFSNTQGLMSAAPVVLVEIDGFPDRRLFRRGNERRAASPADLWHTKP